MITCSPNLTLFLRITALGIGNHYTTLLRPLSAELKLYLYKIQMLQEIINEHKIYRTKLAHYSRADYGIDSKFIEENGSLMSASILCW